MVGNGAGKGDTPRPVNQKQYDENYLAIYGIHCPSCNLTLDRAHFHKSNQTKNGLAVYCRDCTAIKKKKEYGRNAEKYKQRALDTYYKDTEKARFRNIKQRFGISKEQYLEMEKTQNSLCAICGNEKVGHGKERLCVDHNHETGEVRGLLCSLCNVMLGHARDSEELLQKAIDYLRIFGKPKYNIMEEQDETKGKPDSSKDTPR